MSVFLRGKVYHYDFWLDNERHQGTTRMRNEKDAEEVEHGIRTKLIKSAAGVVEKVKPIKFKVAMKEYIAMNEHTKWAKNTRLSYDNQLKHLLPFFGEMYLQDITAVEIQKYRAQRKKQISERTGDTPKNSTINAEIRCLRPLLRSHKLWSILKEGTDLCALPVGKSPGRSLTNEEITRVFNAAKRVNSHTVYPAVVISILTGLRFIELRHLQWKLVDLAGGMLQVGRSKTQSGEGRFVPLPPFAVEVLTDWKAKLGNRVTPESYVFPGKMSQRRKDGVLLRASMDVPMGLLVGSWIRIREIAGVQCRWHDMRHSCATRIAKSGANSQTIRDMFGWVSDDMMKIYLHGEEKEKQQASLAAFDNPEFLSLLGTFEAATGA
jgi:integrase